MDIKGKRIVLTGATGGIGEQVATTLALKGAKLILIGRQEELLERLRQQLPEPQHHVIFVADFLEDDALTKLNQDILLWVDQHGEKIDVLVNNAGHTQFGTFTEKALPQIDLELSLNLRAPIQLCHFALNGWLNKRAVIMNIGSTYGAIGYPGFAVYGAAKAGLHRFSEALNRELGQTGIKVIYLAPRATKTSLNSKVMDELNQTLGNNVDLPADVALSVCVALEKEVRCQWLGWPEKLFVIINQLFPGMVEKTIQKQLPTLFRYMKMEQSEERL